MRWLTLFVLPFLLCRPAAAALTTTFEGCSDTAGHTVAVVADETLPRLVASSVGEGQPTIRYNPALLPRLRPETRLFFFAHECARHAMGSAGSDAHSVAQSRQADCLGLATLLGAGLLKRGDLPALKADLEFSETEWSLLPGLPRAFDLDACPSSGVVRLPTKTLPPEVRTPWNACIRACADPLLRCQRKCRDESCIESCMNVASQCEANCPQLPK